MSGGIWASTSRRTAGCLAAVICGIGMISGCSLLLDAEGLVSLEGGTGLNCTPADEQGRASIGFSHIANQSTHSLSVLEAELVDADGLELIGLELLPPDDPYAHFVGYDYDVYGPEALHGPLEVAAGEERVVVVGLSNGTDRLGSAEGVELTYQLTNGIGTSTVQTSYALQVVPHGEVC